MCKSPINLPIIYFRKDEQLYKDFYKTYELEFYIMGADPELENSLDQTTLSRFFYKLAERVFLDPMWYNQNHLKEHEKNELQIARESRDLLYNNAFKLFC